MSDRLEPESMMREISDLDARIAELRQAAGMPAADLRATLDAALVELELALTALRAMGTDQSTAAGRSATAESERRVLRTVFQDVPVPLFLLDRDASVRRVNRQAAALLGTSPGYVSGKQFTAFCDLPTRAVLRSQLAAVVRTGRRSRAQVRFLGGHPVDALVTLARVWIRGEPDPMVVAAAGPFPAEPDSAFSAGEGKCRIPGGTGDTAVPKQHDQPAGTSASRSAASKAHTGAPQENEVVATIVHRMDVLAEASELLLKEPVFNETIAVRRCARLLASELADWVFIDLAAESAEEPPDDDDAERGELRRQVVMGPPDERSVEAARELGDLVPAPDTLPATVYGSRHSALRPHVEDLELLGTRPDGQPVCATIGASSVLCVPVEDGERRLGTITLAVSGEHGPFDLLDLSVVQRLGRYLALVIRASRLYRRRAQVADSLQASLLPKQLPTVPGLALAGRYLGATHGVEVGGDFYDVFPMPDGWGMVLGDVCGKGEDAAAVTATARHGVRLLSRWKGGPADVLAQVNEVLLEEDRFVTAVMAELAPPLSKPSRERVMVSLGSAGHPPAIVVRSDGMIRTASGGGVPLGLFEDFDAGEETVDLDVGDTLFLHSDGVLEACDMLRQQFGLERLLEVLAANAAASLDDMLCAVEKAVSDFCDGDLRDDMSMLAVRVLPPRLN
jgi:serine phosphatase RsbU (regulator of sigma subunit)/PAS domain-containing protein